MFVGLNDERILHSVDTRDEFLSYMLDTAAHIRKGEDQLTRTTRDLRTQIAKCVEDGGIFEHSLQIL
jgi:hypothetical protein